MTFFSRNVRIALAGVLALLLIGKLWTESFHMRIIPAEIGISYPLARGGVSDLREGCGAAVYRIDKDTTNGITQRGLKYFPATSHSRKAADPYHTFEAWRPTPDAAFVHDDQTLLSPGLECAALDMHLKEQIEKASRTTGAFYTHGPEKLIIVIPELRLVVLAYNG